MAKNNVNHKILDKIKDKIKSCVAPDAIPESKWEEMNLKLKKMRNRRRVYVALMALEFAVIIYLLIGRRG